MLALDLFEADGFDAVTIDDVAAAGGVSASTIYRYFGTKEGLVVWDETDAGLEEELSRRLTETAPVQAFRDTLITAFADEKANTGLLRRVRFLYAVPQVHAAAIEQDLKDREELAVGYALAAGRKKPSLEDEVRASVCIAALDAAIGRWQRKDNRTPLATLIEQAFAAFL